MTPAPAKASGVTVALDPALDRDRVLDPALEGEPLLVPERVVVAPANGTFRSLPPDVFTAEGEIVEAGQPIGTVEGPGLDQPVRSPFRGFLMGMMAHPGERLREGQPVAWLRAL